MAFRKEFKTYPIIIPISHSQDAKSKTKLKTKTLNDPGTQVDKEDPDGTSVVVSDVSMHFGWQWEFT